MRLAILTLTTVLLSLTAFSQGSTETTKMEVEGVCGMCKDRIENAANMTKGVKSSEWDKNTHTLTVTYKANKTSPEAIGMSLAEIGHDNQYAKASDKQYAKIHKCCRYREMHTH